MKKTSSIRKIRLYGEVNEDMAEKFSTELDDLLKEDSKSPIHVEICSGGGCPYSALAIYGRIVSCPVQFIGFSYGFCHSAATLIFAACDDRRASRDSWFMTHEDSGESDEKSTKDLVAFSQQRSNEERHWSELMAKRTKKTVNFWRELSERTTYFKHTAAIEHGLAHSIITEDKK